MPAQRTSTTVTVETLAVQLVPFDRRLLDAAVADDATFARAIGAEVVDGWMPDRDALSIAADTIDDDGGFGLFAVLVEAGRYVVGNAGFLGPPTAGGEVEIGYAIAPAFAGQGLATAVVRTLVARAFDSSAVVAVVARTAKGNAASARVLEKAGFVLAGESFDPDAAVTVQHHRLAGPRR
jgi:ribosomal-protein-alanine N-acetyltransferase